ncbi:Polynucleotide 5'-hydroxyl-kinase GRC3 [Trichinella spiralis]|uniref:Polynucleotide 5'-hydroxyl-kinase GRC3 n=1 Tax=Trichinella spiralis TaxID=6334 RepID=A0ABR3KEC3_TRISP
MGYHHKFISNILRTVKNTVNLSFEDLHPHNCEGGCSGRNGTDLVGRQRYHQCMKTWESLCNNGASLVKRFPSMNVWCHTMGTIVAKCLLKESPFALALKYG